MKLWFHRCLILLSLAAAASLATPQLPPDREPFPPSADQHDSDPKLPNGKSQRDAILKQEHEQNLKDAAQLVQLTHDVQDALEKNDAHVLPLATLKKIDEIEKLVKKIRSRLAHD
jgi:hypothetical protein